MSSTALPSPRAPFADATNLPAATPRRPVAKPRPSAAPRPRAPVSPAATSLRALAIRVAAQLKRAGPCRYADVADALVRAGAGAGEAMSVRRRVNDALNVLVAAGVVTRSADRVIAWNWVFGADEDVRAACDRVAEARAAALAARDRRDRLEAQVRAFELIVQRNATQVALGAAAPPDDDAAGRALHFPFMLVSMPHENASCYATSADQRRSDVTVSMGSPFQILDDCAVLERVAQLDRFADMPSPLVHWPDASNRVGRQPSSLPFTNQ